MKKNTKIIVWSIVGLVVATGAFFGIRSLVKKSKTRNTTTDTLSPAPDVTNSNAEGPPTGAPTQLSQAQANALAFTIKAIITKGQGTPEGINKVKTLTNDLIKGGYTYSEGKAIKNAG